MKTAIERRGFLKLGAALIGALTLTKYAEPLVTVADTHHDWIEDKGDYLIVRVPDFKTFANEVISKPVIFILGEQAIVRAVDVEGFANIYAPKGGLVTATRFDGSRMVTEKERPLVNLKAKNLTISDCNFIGRELPLLLTSTPVQLADFRGDIVGRKFLTTKGWENT